MEVYLNILNPKESMIIGSKILVSTTKRKGKRSLIAVVHLPLPEITELDQNKDKYEVYHRTIEI